MNNINNHVPLSVKECSGCGICVSFCKKQAITMIENEEGFQIPIVKTSSCNSCGLCLSKCSFLHPFLNKKTEMAYLAKNKDERIRLNSRSGAVFVSFSDYILSKNGSVYGSVLDGDCVAHTRAVTAGDRDKQCKSKYVQSNTNQIWFDVKKDLNDGKIVLFTGTSCQVSALYSYLNYNKVDTDCLFTMDVVCHGVPSPKLFRDYYRWLISKYGVIREFNFRDKLVCGWDGHIESFYVGYEKKQSTVWKKLFYTNSCLRPSCSNCKYSSLERSGDVTIADAWGVKKTAPSFNDNKGVSLVLVNNAKGKFIINELQKTCDMLNVKVEHMLQPNLKGPSFPLVNRTEFWNIYKNSGIEGLINKYGSQSIVDNFLYKLKYLMRKLFLGKKYFLP